MIKHGFSCERAPNGGWVVYQPRAEHDRLTMIASFTSSDDFLNWIDTQLGALEAEAKGS